MKDRKSIRLPEFDYSSENFYFITICTYMKHPFLGKIVGSDFIPSDAGVMVRNCWDNIDERYHCISTGEFIIMPNHIHGIINISSSNDSNASSLYDVVRNLKAYTTHDVYTKRIICKLWQRGYYEHVIRDEFELMRIQAYIRNNVSSWARDKYYLD